MQDKYWIMQRARIYIPCHEAYVLLLAVEASGRMTPQRAGDANAARTNVRLCAVCRLEILCQSLRALPPRAAPLPAIIIAIIVIYRYTVSHVAIVVCIPLSSLNIVISLSFLYTVTMYVVVERVVVERG